MDFALEKVPERGVDEPVAGHGGEAPERLGSDAHPEMAAAPGGAGMPGVQVAVVGDGELGGRKLRREPRTQPFLAGYAGHGGEDCAGTGLTLPFSHTICGIMKSSIAMLMPKTLKFTQTLSVKFRAT